MTSAFAAPMAPTTSTTLARLKCVLASKFSRPSMGSGSFTVRQENQNLPGFCGRQSGGGLSGAAALVIEFLPSAYQGTLVRDLKNPIANLTDPSRSGSPARQARRDP